MIKRKFSEGIKDYNQLLDLYNSSLEELFKILYDNYYSDEIEFCSLISAKTGKCSQNCKYCAQSSYYRTEIETHPLVSLEDVKKAAIDGKNNYASRFAIVTSGKGPEENDFNKILDMIKVVNQIKGLKSCASLGILDETQVKQLKEAGLVRYHHNINTCESYYSSICTTHSYNDRIKTIQLVKKYNLELCAGVILGMGETKEQRIEMALELAALQPDSVPVNFLMPIKNTPFENYIDKIDEENILKTLCIFKIAMPNSVIRLAGGRSLRLSEENQNLALKYAISGIIIGNMLTTTCKDPKDDIKNVQELGKKIVCTNI